MNERVRVNNVTPYAIGLKSQTGIEYNIRPRAFVVMHRDDVEYNMAIAPGLFRSPAKLIVEDQELSEIMGIVPVEETSCDKETIDKILKSSAAKIEAWLNENNYPHVIETLLDAAKDMDLPASKIKVLQKFAPNRDIVEE